MDRKERGEQLNQRVEEAFAVLAEQLAEGHTHEFVELLEFYASFRSYSMGNLWLIKSQRPNATRCAGYKQWEKLGYQVREGEKAIWIRGPMLKKFTDPNTGEIHERLLGWLALPVFDVSQLEGDVQLPSPRHVLEGEYSPLYDLTRIAIAGTGLMVDEEPLPQGVHGMSMGGRIVIAPQLSDAEKCLCAWHEWCHELLHRDKDRDSIPKKQRELEAESASFIMARMMGLDNPFSRDYIIHYKGTVEDLHASLTRIHGVCKKMYGILHVEEPTQAAVAA
jgi:hypothetical protein